MEIIFKDEDKNDINRAMRLKCIDDGGDYEI